MDSFNEENNKKIGNDIEDVKVEGDFKEDENIANIENEEQKNEVYSDENNVEDKKTFAITSLILAIISIFLAWFGYSAILGLASSIVAIVMAVKSKKEESPNAYATAGLIISIVGVCLNGLGLIACVACAGGLACLGGLNSLGI